MKGKKKIKINWQRKLEFAKRICWRNCNYWLNISELIWSIPVRLEHKLKVYRMKLTSIADTQLEYNFLFLISVMSTKFSPLLFLNSTVFWLLFPLLPFGFLFFFVYFFYFVLYIHLFFSFFFSIFFSNFFFFSFYLLFSFFLFFFLTILFTIFLFSFFLSYFFFFFFLFFFFFFPFFFFFFFPSFFFFFLFFFFSFVVFFLVL